jgi:hypothetical protein
MRGRKKSQLHLSLSMAVCICLFLPLSVFAGRQVSARCVMSSVSPAIVILVCSAQHRPPGLVPTAVSLIMYYRMSALSENQTTAAASLEPQATGLGCQNRVNESLIPS